MSTTYETDILTGEGAPACAAEHDAGSVEDVCETVSLRRRIRRWYYHRLMRLLMLLHNGLLVAAKFLGNPPRRRPKASGHDILLTGRFESDNWVRAHLQPLAASRGCSRLRVVSTYPVPAMANVEAIYPPAWLVRMLGATGARLAVFVAVAVRRRPDIVGGFHLLINGLVAVVLARLVGARSMYFCVGGPAEVIDGGVWSETACFCAMGSPDPVVERRLVTAVANCDHVITMGTRAVEFFRKRGVRTGFHVVPGGIDSSRFSLTGERRTFDIVTVGRLVEVKRIDVYLRAIQLAARQIGQVDAAIVGDGPVRRDMENLAKVLGIAYMVHFPGRQTDISGWLNRSRVFVLTSDSEGLSLALMEAMTCGLPAVVADVGDLADLVEDGVNGYLVSGRQPEQFAERLVELLRDHRKYERFSDAARRSAMRYGTSVTTRRWDEILGGAWGAAPEAD